MLEDSEAFKEFLFKRCEEILSKDENHKKTNAEIIDMEKEFKSLLTPELIKIYDRIILTITEATAKDEATILKHTLFDRFYT